MLHASLSNISNERQISPACTYYGIDHFIRTLFEIFYKENQVNLYMNVQFSQQASMLKCSAWEFESIILGFGRFSPCLVWSGMAWRETVWYRGVLVWLAGSDSVLGQLKCISLVQILQLRFGTKLNNETNNSKAIHTYRKYLLISVASDKCNYDLLSEDSLTGVCLLL